MITETQIRNIVNHFGLSREYARFARLIRTGHIGASRAAQIWYGKLLRSRAADSGNRAACYYALFYVNMGRETVSRHWRPEIRRYEKALAIAGE